MANNSWPNEEMNQHNFDNSRAPLKRAELRNNTGFAMEWSLEEQAILDKCLATYSSESSVARYARISSQLPLKTAKDVAMRCRWINELGRVKAESSSSAPQDAFTDELHKQNEQLFEQISANLTIPSKLIENVTLINQVRENIMKLVDKCYENAPDQMKHMPPLSLALNDHLFNFILQYFLYP